MENELTTLENMNRQLECRGFDFECKFYNTLEEKLLNDKEYEQYLSDKNDMIERLNFDLEEIRREVDTKDVIIRKLKKQREAKEIKTSIFNNLDDESSDNNINLTPIVNNRNSDMRISKALFNVENLDNFNGNNVNKDSNNENDGVSRKDSYTEQKNLSKRNSKANLENKIDNRNGSINKDNKSINNENNLNFNNNTSILNLKSNSIINNINNEQNISEINDHNKSNIFNSKTSKIYAKEDIHDLNVQAISAKIDDVLNNSLKEYNLNLLDKSLNNNNNNNERNNNTNNNTPVNNKLNNSNDENEEKEFIKQIIDQEVKNILENRKLFILSTLTQENFSFDFVHSKILNGSDLTNVNKKKIPNKAKIIENIDEILLKIQARREKVLNQKKLMMNKLEKMGIKIF